MEMILFLTEKCGNQGSAEIHKHSMSLHLFVFFNFFHPCLILFQVHIFYLLEWVSESCSVVSNSLRLHGLNNAWNSPGQNTGVGSCHFSRGSSQPWDWTQVSCTTGGFLTSWATREAQEYWSGKPIHPFSRGSSQPRNQTGVSWIVGGFFTNWAVR